MDVDHVFSEIEAIVIKTIISAESKMVESFKKVVPYRTNCFELLGFDVMLDSKLKPWLLEVNLAPSLTCDTTVDQKIKAPLVADLFTLAGLVPADKQTLAADPREKLGSYRNNAPKAPKPAKTMKRTLSTPFLMNTMPTRNNRPQASPSVLYKGKMVEKQVLKETEDEFKRKGNFKRIFPDGKLEEYESFFKMP